MAESNLTLNMELPAKGDTQKKREEKPAGYEPPNLGKATRLTVPDFNDPQRPAVCLEVDFPIAQINALSNLEGNAGKPVYQMSKWWARRRSSVFRSLLIAAALQAPEQRDQAAKLVWDYYYANHQKAGHFRKLKVLEPFMGGGTTLVEGARLGFHVTGNDLNPVAWFVCKNEVACSDPQQVRAFFDHIEAEVKPQIQPFYTTTCPRNHQGRWIDVESGQAVDIDPLDLAPEARNRYRWEGPEVIYTFWAKHGPCQAHGCNHRTPIFKSPVIAEKRLTTYFIECRCPDCRQTFQAELGETRMAPGAERVVLPNEPVFTELSQSFAKMLSDYGKGNSDEKRRRVGDLAAMAPNEPGFRCPHCNAFAGEKVINVLQRHGKPSTKIGDIKKKDFGIQSYHVYMYLLIHPDWLKGSQNVVNGIELGGWAGADPDATATWYAERQNGLSLIEVRGQIKLSDEESAPADEDESEGEDAGEEGGQYEAPDRKQYGLPLQITLRDGTVINTRKGTVPSRSSFSCQSCGRPQDILEAVRATEKTAPVSAYALQCYCPQCAEEGYTYDGRYFIAPDTYDLKRLLTSEKEWGVRSTGDLAEYWPKSELFPSYMTHRLNGGIPNWGFTHWWKMFNPRQLLTHANLLKSISEGADDEWSLDVKEQALGAFQQYLRNQNMFAFWNQTADKMEPMFSNANYHPKQQTIENSVFSILGRGNWESSSSKIVDGISWLSNPWELVIAPTQGITKSEKAYPEDPISVYSGGQADTYCGSSTDLSQLEDKLFDLVITDPPFGDNLFYADLADFFYVWLRIPMLKWYVQENEHWQADMKYSPRRYFEPERSPHAMEAIRNPLEHPDDREPYEREPIIRSIDDLYTIQQVTGDAALGQSDPNPLYRQEPASEFYRKTLTACWEEAHHHLKPGGLMAFTFHHSQDAPWVDVLESLFEAGYVLVATYPIRSDETKGATGAFGSRKIEYDIVHVCRKRLEELEPVSWAQMRRWVKGEAQQLKDLLEHTHGKDLPESDLMVILRGKSLEYYSRHYSQVYTGEGKLLSVREALLGINLLIDDIMQDEVAGGRPRPPDIAEPVTRLFLRLFTERKSIARDELHKTLRGTGISQEVLEANGWIRASGTTIQAVPIPERFRFFTSPGRTRAVLKTDLDQAYFLTGAASKNSGLDVTAELNKKTFRLKKSVDAILQWFMQMAPDAEIRTAAKLAFDLTGHWRAHTTPTAIDQQLSFLEEE